MGNLRSNPVQAGTQITYKDLHFKQIPISMDSSRGTPQTRWVDSGMPKISDRVLRFAFYLYRSREDAEEGKKYGGTGFLVSVPSKRFPGYSWCHGVTNWHVALDKGCSVIRLNTLDGKTDIIEFDPIEWEWIPNKDDIAVSPVILYKRGLHDITHIAGSTFATDKKVKDFRIGIGDDVFMVGRFIDHSGEPTNSPAVRFGNISVMPSPIEQPNGYRGDSYCIDLHSRTGFSGSPVMVYRTHESDLEQRLYPEEFKEIPGAFLFLLGIHWGQFREKWPIVSENEPAESEQQDLITTGEYVKGLSGMTCVIPAQRIMDVLNLPRLKEQRREKDAQMLKRFLDEGFPAEAETNNPGQEIISDNENPQHKEDFNSLLTAAAKRKPPVDET